MPLTVILTFSDVEEYFGSSFHRSFQLWIWAMVTLEILCSWRHTLRRVTSIMVIWQLN